MSSLKLFVLLGLVALSLAFPIPTDQEEKDIYDILPEEIKKFYHELTEADLAVFQKLKPQLKNKDDAESYELIKAENPSLADRVKAMYTAIYTKIENLSTEPKQYLTNLIHAIEEIDASTTEQWFEKLDKAVNAAGKPAQGVQNEIVQIFPTLKNLWYDM